MVYLSLILQLGKLDSTYLWQLNKGDEIKSTELDNSEIEYKCTLADLNIKEHTLVTACPKINQLDA